MATTKDFTFESLPAFLRYVGSPDGGIDIPASISAGAPDLIVETVTGWTYTWDTTWTPAQDDEWAEAEYTVERALARGQPIDDTALVPFWDVMRAYYNNNSPATGETVQALKATIKVLREMNKE